LVVLLRDAGSSIAMTVGRSRWWGTDRDGTAGLDPGRALAGWAEYEAGRAAYEAGWADYEAGWAERRRDGERTAYRLLASGNDPLS